MAPKSSQQKGCKNGCISCCKYNWHRSIWYLLIIIITIGIMVGVDYALKETNKCFNTYSMFAQLFNPNQDYQYLCYQNEIEYSLLSAFILLFTFHAIFAIILFHLIQSIIIKQKGIDSLLIENEDEGPIRKPYNYHSPPISSNTVKKQRKKNRKKNKHLMATDYGQPNGSSSDEDNDSDDMLQSSPNNKGKKSKSRKRKNKKYGAVNLDANEEDGYDGYDGTR